ncbi:hypothetical protein Dimus_033779 [Dionaea muscipula]
MAESYTSLPTSQLLGSVPAVVIEDEKNTNAIDYVEGGQPSTNWQGVFNISSYAQYFNVDTDIVLNRLLSSLKPVSGDFFSRIDANPDLYGLVWVSTTLVFVIAALGNCATYFMDKLSNGSTSWSFNVNYLNMAACLVYGYVLVVPLAFYFLIQYLGSNANVVRFWCMWGYSLFILVITSFLMLIPVEILRWMIILLAGGASACFVSLNLKSYVEGNDLTIVLVAAFVLQLGLALMIKYHATLLPFMEFTSQNGACVMIKLSDLVNAAQRKR